MNGDMMKIRLGYVGTPITIPNITYSSTVTYTNYLKLGEQKGLEKIDQVIQSNFHHLKKVLHYNLQNNITFYRLSQNLIPLATKKEVSFDYSIPYQQQFSEISQIIHRHHMRIDTHPDQFCVLNSTKKEVVEQSIQILKFHYQLLTNLKMPPHMILHIGSNTFGKKQAMARFKKQFLKLPNELQKSIYLENDDKTFTVNDTLSLCEELHVPFVLDYHHHCCNHEQLDLTLLLPRIVNTWKDTKLNPKMHFSSPKNRKEFRSHSEYLDIQAFLKFLKILQPLATDIDIMLECKAKDDALFRLMRQIQFYTDYQIINESTFLI